MLIKFTPSERRVLHFFQLTLLVTSSILQNHFCSLIYYMKRLSIYINWHN